MKQLGILFLLLFLTIEVRAKEDTWEQATARRFSQAFRDNDARLKAIAGELAHLPNPYKGEPTGNSIGYLSPWQESSQAMVKLIFKWKQEREVSAVALLPLRTHLGNEGSTVENAYWPRSIRIYARKANKLILLSHITNSQQHIRQSLPELIEFQPITTTGIEIFCTDLPRRPTTPRNAAGFAEIFVFSGEENIAPRAELLSEGRREGYRVLSPDYLIDEQTPLGLPEQGPRTVKGLGLYDTTIGHILPEPVIFNMTFEEDVWVDAVRLDPVIINKPGQSFPLRYSIKLLDEGGLVLRSNHDYKEFPLINPGLNPHTAWLGRVKTRSIQITFFEAAKPTQEAHPTILLSEITPMFRGTPLLVPATLSGTSRLLERNSRIIDPSVGLLEWSLASVYDGMTQQGKVLSHYKWIKGLAMRQKLLEEQSSLEEGQRQITATTRSITLWSTSLLTLGLISLATIISIRSRTRARHAIQQVRESIASDLHDETGSSLAAIALHAGQLRAQTKDPSKLKSLSAILRLSKESGFGLREVLHTTAPRVGREQDIFNYMRELAELILAGKKFNFQSSNFPNNEDALSPQLRKDLILFYKEALSNSEKHSQCNEVKISLTYKKRLLIMKFEDDGVGMTEAQLARPRALRTLKQRANRLNGELEIESEPGKGLRLTLQAPL